MTSRETQSTIILYVKSVYHPHHLTRMMKTETQDQRLFLSQIITEEQRKKTWSMWYPGVSGAEVIKKEEVKLCSNI